ncbi:hypothetical protein F5887DRAFT_1074674 [Amanita rubescens]|nr:hypothetical protein F5887DRAFT_1074674 [Amanita rubescens]
MVRVAVTTIAAFVQLTLLAQNSFGLPIQWICGYAGALKRWNRKALHSTALETRWVFIMPRAQTQDERSQPRQDDPGLIVVKGPHHPTPPPSPPPRPEHEPPQVAPHDGLIVAGSPHPPPLSPRPEQQPHELSAEGSRQNAVPHPGPTKEYEIALPIVMYRWR